MPSDEALCRIIVLLCLSCIKLVNSINCSTALSTKHVLHLRCKHRRFDPYSTRRQAINDIHNHEKPCLPITFVKKTKTTDVNQNVWISNPHLSTPTHIDPRSRHIAPYPFNLYVAQDHQQAENSQPPTINQQAVASNRRHEHTITRQQPPASIPKPGVTSQQPQANSHKPIFKKRGPAAGGRTPSNI